VDSRAQVVLSDANHCPRTLSRQSLVPGASGFPGGIDPSVFATLMNGTHE
jgi:hypothetical protein